MAKWLTVIIGLPNRTGGLATFWRVSERRKPMAGMPLVKVLFRIGMFVHICTASESCLNPIFDEIFSTFAEV
jgi:hypothetical protein